MPMPFGPISWRTLSNSEAEPQVMSMTQLRRFFLPVAGFWLSRVTMRERMLEAVCGV